MKKTLYPKTERIGSEKVFVTEKLDGACLGIFKLNGELYFAQRNHVLAFSELTKQNAYGGLRGWAEENMEQLMQLIEGSCVFGEWIGMGQIGYGDTDINKRFYIFAKANVVEDEYGEIDANRINYNHDLFIYPFECREIPECMDIVPVVTSGNSVLSIGNLNNLYLEYTEQVGRKVEGFVVSFGNGIKKYVRLKRGKLTEHISN
jgi:hypothetical protein